MTRYEFYRSKAWTDYRKTLIASRAEDDGFVRCAICGKPIVNPKDLIVHHIIELDDDNCNDATIALNPANTVCVHHACHNKEHDRFGHKNYMSKGRSVYLVWGAPCSGKRTYVLEHALPTDLVVDIDSIWQMVTTNNRYDKPDRLASVIFDIRDSLYDAVKYRRGRWSNAWVIATAPHAAERERLKARIAATEEVFITASMEECITRAKQQRPAEYIKYIEEWFDRFQK